MNSKATYTPVFTSKIIRASSLFEKILTAYRTITTQDIKIKTPFVCCFTFMILVRTAHKSNQATIETKDES